jgi:hypothetical protein
MQKRRTKDTLQSHVLTNAAEQYEASVVLSAHAPDCMQLCQTFQLGKAARLHPLFHFPLTQSHLAAS